MLTKIDGNALCVCVCGPGGGGGGWGVRAEDLLAESSVTYFNPQGTSAG